GRWELSAKAQDASIDAWLYGAKDQRALRDKQIWSLDDQGNLAVPTGTSLAQLARAHPREYGSVMAANIRHMAGYLAAPEAGKVASWLLLPLPVWAVAVYGAWRYRRSRLTWLLLAVAALPVVTGIVYFVSPRYLLLLVGLATIFVGAGLAAVG